MYAACAQPETTLIVFMTDSSDAFQLRYIRDRSKRRTVSCCSRPKRTTMQCHKLHADSK